jgi:hypothetical protein
MTNKHTTNSKRSTRWLRRGVRPQGTSPWYALKNLLRLWLCIAERKCGISNTPTLCPSSEQVRSNGATAASSRNNADKVEPNLPPTNKAGDEIRVSFADRLEVAGLWLDTNKPSQIAILRCSQGPRLIPIVISILDVPATMLLPHLPLSLGWQNCIWRLMILVPSLWFLSIPLYVRVTSELGPNR